MPMLWFYFCKAMARVVNATMKLLGWLLSRG